MIGHSPGLTVQYRWNPCEIPAVNGPRGNDNVANTDVCPARRLVPCHVCLYLQHFLPVPVQPSLCADCSLSETHRQLTSEDCYYFGVCPIWTSRTCRSVVPPLA